MQADPVWPLGLRTPVWAPRTAQPANATLSSMSVPSTPPTASSQAARPRHHPDAANTMAVTRASGSTTAWSAKSVRNCTMDQRW